MEIIKDGIDNNRLAKLMKDVQSIATDGIPLIKLLKAEKKEASPLAESAEASILKLMYLTTTITWENHSATLKEVMDQASDSQGKVDALALSIAAFVASPELTKAVNDLSKDIKQLIADWIVKA